MSLGALTGAVTPGTTLASVMSLGTALTEVVTPGTTPTGVMSLSALACLVTPGTTPTAVRSLGAALTGVVTPGTTPLGALSRGTGSPNGLKTNSDAAACAGCPASNVTTGTGALAGVATAKGLAIVARAVTTAVSCLAESGFRTNGALTAFAANAGPETSTGVVLISALGAASRRIGSETGVSTGGISPESPGADGGAPVSTFFSRFADHSAASGESCFLTGTSCGICTGAGA